MVETATSISELFDPSFLESVQRLRIIARRVARGGRHAEQRSRDLGSGIEFRDFRPYAPGDDFRAIDWNIYRRLGRVFLRLFEEMEDLPLYLLPDVSRSLWVESPPRVRAGLRCSMALAAISLGQHDSVGLYPFGSDVEPVLAPRAGKNRLYRFASTLAGLAPSERTDFSTSLRRFASWRQRAGLAVVISDFFDPRGLEAVTSALRRLRHRLLLVQLVRASDREPGLEGDLQLRDCETGETEDVSATPAVLARYRDAYDRFQEGLAAFARERQAGLLRLDADREVVPQLATLFETGSFLV